MQYGGAPNLTGSYQFGGLIPKAAALNQHATLDIDNNAALGINTPKVTSGGGMSKSLLIGSSAGIGISRMDECVLIGAGVGKEGGGGSWKQSTFIGCDAGLYSAGSYRDTVVGMGARQYAGGESVFVGSHCAKHARNVQGSVLVGANCFHGPASSITDTVAFGCTLGENFLNQCVETVVVGTSALAHATGDVLQSVVIGHGAAADSSSSMSNSVVIGQGSANAISGSCENTVVVGKGACGGNVFSSIANAVIIGTEAVKDAKGAVSGSVIIGSLACSNLVSYANQSVLIGQACGMNSGGLDGVVAIGDNACSEKENIKNTVVIGSSLTGNSSSSLFSISNVVIIGQAVEVSGAGTLSNSTILGCHYTSNASEDSESLIVACNQERLLRAKRGNHVELSASSLTLKNLIHSPSRGWTIPAMSSTGGGLHVFQQGTLLSNNVSIGDQPFVSGEETLITISNVSISSGVGLSIMYPESNTYTAVSYRANGIQVGSILCNASSVSFTTISDAKLKDNVHPLNLEVAKDTVRRLAPSSFQWKKTGAHSQCGYIAQEVERVVPKAVYTCPFNGMKSVDHKETLPYIVRALQEYL